uniref:F-131 protein n=1 Tax=Saccharomyces cerevisiae TaxID=4932 RepID=E9PA49_YEASX|nr:F-131 protein [Saccharomyces cerevisiae]
MTLAVLSMFNVFNNKLLAPPSSKSTKAFLNNGSIINSWSSSFILIVSNSTNVVSKTLLYTLRLVLFTSGSLDIGIPVKGSISIFASSLSPPSPSPFPPLLSSPLDAPFVFLCANPLNNLPVSVVTESTLEE